MASGSLRFFGNYLSFSTNLYEIQNEKTNNYGKQYVIFLSSVILRGIWLNPSKTQKELFLISELFITD
jgi:hypothetical protein